jgi:hypothetical protein
MYFQIYTIKKWLSTPFFCWIRDYSCKIGILNTEVGMKKKVLLLGASVGGAWKINLLPERIDCQDYVFEYVHGGSAFDKSVKLREILNRKENKPDAIFLKECAAYFPGDFERYKELMEKWVVDCREAGVVPIPATTIPVTKLHAWIVFFGYPILRGKNPLMFGWPFQQKRQKSICEYNDWLREFAPLQGLALLDLEAALRRGEKDRYLRGDLARKDGLHLKPKAYPLLDKIVLPTIEGRLT